MSVDECIRAYKKVAERAFTPKRRSILPAPPSGTFSATQLENAIKQTIREFCVDPKCVAQRVQGKLTTVTCPHSEMEFRDGLCSKTYVRRECREISFDYWLTFCSVVLAITKDIVDASPTLFTTYDTSAGFQDCTVWQVARATSAATTFFKPIKVGRDNIELVDAGFGFNSPSEVLIDEAQQQFPGRGPMRILSIGTGLGDVVTIGNTRMSILQALKKMATTSKKVASRLDSRFGGSNEYHRFNVDRGLEDTTLSDWEQACQIAAHTRYFLAENQRAVQKFIHCFISLGTGTQAGTGPEARGCHEPPTWCT